MPITKEQLQQYANLKEQEKAIQAEIKKMAPLILEGINETGGDKIHSPGVGDFIVTKKSNWKFSPAVDAAEEVVETLKKEEKAKGVATVEMTQFITFKAEKVKDEIV